MFRFRTCNRFPRNAREILSHFMYEILYPNANSNILIIYIAQEIRRSSTDKENEFGS